MKNVKMYGTSLFRKIKLTMGNLKSIQISGTGFLISRIFSKISIRCIPSGNCVAASTKTTVWRPGGRGGRGAAG